jgi:enterochelin esterase-like enzyme
LHGSPGIALDWIRGGFADRAMDTLIRERRVRPFLVVFPDFNLGYRRDTECQDVVRGPQIQTFLTRYLVHYVDTHFRTVPSRRARAIGGLSTGGYCGINLGFRHPDVFSAVVSHSGYFAPDVNAYTGNLFGGDAHLRALNTPDYYLPSIRIVRPMGAYLDAGTEDRDSLGQSERMAWVMRDRGVDVTFLPIARGAHTWVEWHAALAFSLPWVSHWFALMGTAAPPDPAPTVVSYRHTLIA